MARTMYDFNQFLNDIFAEQRVDWRDDEALRTFISGHILEMDEETRRQITRMRYSLNHPNFNDGDSLFVTSGLFKSGTTWFGALLNVHPGLYCGHKELHPFSRQLTDLYTNRRIDELPDEERKTWGEIILDNRRAALTELILSRADNPFAKRLGARGPVANLRALIHAFPKIRLPIILRDPRDIAVSAAHFHGRYYKQGWERFFANEDRTVLNPEFVKGWAWQAHDYYQHVFDMAEQFPQNVMYIRYEDLLDAPLKIMQQVYRFLDVSWEENLVRQCVEKCSFENMSGGRRRGEEDRDSFFRKGTSGDWENYFDEECREACKSQANQVMQKLGYLW